MGTIRWTIIIKWRWQKKISKIIMSGVNFALALILILQYDLNQQRIAGGSFGIFQIPWLTMQMYKKCMIFLSWVFSRCYLFIKCVKIKLLRLNLNIIILNIQYIFFIISTCMLVLFAALCWVKNNLIFEMANFIDIPYTLRLVLFSFTEEHSIMFFYAICPVI